MNGIRLRPATRQRGVASLVVVMVLFFIVSMVAAYTNRNLIFEQRTSANQYRSTQALEAAEAGLEWAKAMLNHGRITPTPTGPSSPAACSATGATAGDTTFRQRYLNIDASTGAITPKTYAAGLGTVKLQPSCVFNGSGWNCDCPAAGPPTLPSSSSAEIRPAFRVRFSTAVGAPPGVVRIEAIGCTRLDATCLDFTALGAVNEGRTVLTELVALTGGLPSPPMAALTSGGAVALTGAAAFHNGDAVSGGWTVQARGAVATAPPLVLTSLPGTPGSVSVVQNDTTLPSTADRMFSALFNMAPDTYRQQPGTVVLDASTAFCDATGCTEAAVRDAVLMNPGRMVWVTGNLTVGGTGSPIGSTAAPALVVVNGNLDFTGNETIVGLVYVRTATWAPTGLLGQVQGALVTQADVSGVGTPTVTYDAAVLNRLRLTTGSFVPVPGGWKDFCSSGTGAPISGTEC